MLAEPFGNGLRTAAFVLCAHAAEREQESDQISSPKGANAIVRTPPSLSSLIECPPQGATFSYDTGD